LRFGVPVAACVFRQGTTFSRAVAAARRCSAFSSL
jgi:hypothetical protein